MGLFALVGPQEAWLCTTIPGGFTDTVCNIRITGQKQVLLISRETKATPFPARRERNKIAHIKTCASPARGIEGKKIQSQRCAPWHHHPGRRKLLTVTTCLPVRKFYWNRGGGKPDAFRTHCCPRRLTPLKQEETSSQFNTAVAIV